MTALEIDLNLSFVFDKKLGFPREQNMPLVQSDDRRSTQPNADSGLMSSANRGVFRVPQPSNLRRSGFSLIELLFVAAVVCLLIALLLPAVQQAREAARRTQCKYRLAQLSIAILNYHDAHSVFPPGCVNETGPIVSQADGLHTSWILQILPMIDQPALALRHDPEISVYDDRHSEIRAHSIATLLCPSDRLLAVTGDDVAVTNYAGVIGGSDVLIDADNTGMFFLNSSVRATDIFDGSSNQIAIAEHCRMDVPSGIDLGWMSGTSATLRNGGMMINAVRLSSKSIPAQYETTGGFSSDHTGGAQVALADGSVRFFSQNVDQFVLRYLCDIQDGHDVADF